MRPSAHWKSMPYWAMLVGSKPVAVEFLPFVSTVSCAAMLSSVSHVQGWPFHRSPTFVGRFGRFALAKMSLL